VRELLLTTLRTSEGLSESIVKERLGLSLDEVISLEKLTLLPDDLYFRSKERLSLTDKGALLADYIVEKITG